MKNYQKPETKSTELLNGTKVEPIPPTNEESYLLMTDIFYKIGRSFILSENQIRADLHENK